MPIVPKLSAIGNLNTPSLIHHQSEWDEAYVLLILSTSDRDEPRRDAIGTFRCPFLSA